MDTIMNKATSFSIDMNADYIFAVRDGNTIHYSGTPTWCANFADKKPIADDSSSLLETKRESIIARLFKKGQIKNVVAPSPHKENEGCEELDFLRRKDLKKEQIKQLQSIKIVSPSGENQIPLQNGITETVAVVKQRICARKRRVEPSDRLSVLESTLGIEGKGKGRGKKSKRGILS